VSPEYAVASLDWSCLTRSAPREIAQSFRQTAPSMRQPEDSPHNAETAARSLMRSTRDRVGYGRKGESSTRPTCARIPTEARRSPSSTSPARVRSSPDSRNTIVRDATAPNAALAPVARGDRRKRGEPPLLSPLRYPGSKRRLAAHIDEILKINGRTPDLFIEAFAGGASVAIRLLQLGRVQQIGLVDLDPMVAAFWRTVFFDTEWLCNAIAKVPVTLAQWQTYRAMKPRSDRSRALICLFLNRTSFSGILNPRAGPIGGYAQKGDFKIDCRFTRETIIDRIRKIAAYRDHVAFVWNTSWDQALANVRAKQAAGELPLDVFYYFDPPFFEKAEQLYTFYFEEADHIALRDALVAMTDHADEPWVLSYDVADRLEELYGDRPESTHIELLYSMSAGHGRKVAKEAILSNLPKLPIPSVDDKRRRSKGPAGQRPKTTKPKKIRVA
jgi:DNA adenine methylase